VHLIDAYTGRRCVDMPHRASQHEYNVIVWCCFWNSGSYFFYIIYNSELHHLYLY